MPGLEDLYTILNGRFFGKYRGVVISNIDDLKRGRLKVKVPKVMGDQEFWALPCVPYAGDQVGFFAMPPDGAMVWIEFEGGDPSYPIWVGCFWSDEQIVSEDAVPTVKFWKTDKLSIRIDDDEGSLTIETENGSVFTIGSSEILLDTQEINQKTGEASVKLSSGGLDVNNGTFTVS